MLQPQVIDLKESFADDRGFFMNVPLDILPEGFKPMRMYFCENFQRGIVRGFHSHKKEAKVFICLRGAVKFVLIPTPFNTGGEGEHVPLSPIILTAKKSQLLYVPPMYANGWQTLTDDTLLLGMSNLTIKESVSDDKRIDPHKYDEYWEVKWR